MRIEARSRCDDIKERPCGAEPGILEYIASGEAEGVVGAILPSVRGDLISGHWRHPWHPVAGNSMDNLVIPWMPLADLPQLPCGISMAGEPEWVTLRVEYSLHGHARDLLIDLSAEVFGCFSEFASPPATVAGDYPRLQHPDYARYLWPLMEVTHSTWLASHRERLWMPDGVYRHYRVVSDEGTFDALTSAEPRARWALPAI